MGYAGVQAAARRSMEALHLRDMGISLHSFRHGGASYDRMVAARGAGASGAPSRASAGTTSRGASASS